jgi:succinate dehydrogenase / fumarate reductase cytochrome b subunit
MLKQKSQDYRMRSRPLAPHHRERPRNLPLATLRLPLPALVSILHRVSGVLLFLSLPGVLWLLQLSLSSAEGYQHVLDLLQSLPVRLLLLALTWALLHHLLAGLRHLALDLHFGLELAQARFTSKLVLLLGLLLTVAAGVALW